MTAGKEAGKKKSLSGRIRALFRKKETEKPEAVRPESQPAPRPRKTCKSCGKSFSYDPSWDHIPNYCKDCRQKLTREKEEKQRAGAPRKITRKCKACGQFFTFPNTLARYPSYCNNCRKRHQAEMKAKYSRKPAEKKES